MTTVSVDREGPSVLVHEHISGGGLSEGTPVSWLVEGSAMRRAIAGDFAAAGARVLMTLDARLPDEPGPWTTHRIAPGSAARSLPDLAARAHHTILIAPETGGLLRDLTVAVRRSGADLLGSAADAIDLAADKLRLAVHFASAGVPHPETRLVHPRSGLPRDAAYPAVLKPVDGAGAVDTVFVGSIDDPIVATYPGEGGIMQPFLTGEPRSATFLVRPGSTPRLVGVGRQAVALRGGRFRYEGGSILAEDLPSEHPARRAAASVSGLAGLIGVDYLHDPMRADVVLEINPRPTTSCVGLIAALGPGRLASAWLAPSRGGFLDLPFPPTPPGRSLAFGADGSIRLRIAPQPPDDTPR